VENGLSSDPDPQSGQRLSGRSRDRD